MLIRKFAVLAVLVGLLAASTAAFAGGKTRLTWYGHAAFKIVTPEGHTLFIDPWITNPSNPTGKADLAGIKKADLILISHAHFDHVGDSTAIAKATGAQLVCAPELSDALVQYGGFPAAQASADVGNAGGSISFFKGDVEVTFTQAVHSSGYAIPQQQQAVPGAAGGFMPPPVFVNLPHNVYGGNPLGFLIKIKNGPVIYHTGDTDVFYDMALIPKTHKVDVMLACIGGKYTMGPSRAAIAVGLVHPAIVIPMHFGTFPALSGTPAEFGKDLKKTGSKTKLVVMKVHQTLTF